MASAVALKIQTATAALAKTFFPPLQISRLISTDVMRVLEGLPPTIRLDARTCVVVFVSHLADSTTERLYEPVLSSHTDERTPGIPSRTPTCLEDSQESSAGRQTSGPERTPKNSTEYSQQSTEESQRYPPRTPESPLWADNPEAHLRLRKVHRGLPKRLRGPPTLHRGLPEFHRGLP